MKRLLLLYILASTLSGFPLLIAQTNFVAKGIGKSYNIGRIDFTNLSAESLSSQTPNYIFDLDNFNTKALQGKGVRVLNNLKEDSELDTFFVLNDYDLETTLLDKVAKQCGLEQMALAMFCSAYNFNFKNLAEPETLQIYSSYYKQLYELDFNDQSLDLSDAFKEDVNRLGRDITAAGFLYRNGTHFASKAYYGGHFLLKNTVDRSAYRFSGLTPKEFADQIKNNIQAVNTGIDFDYKKKPNKIDVGVSENFTIGGESSIKNYKKWKQTVKDNPQLIAVKLTRITKLLNKTNFPDITDLEYKRHVVDSFIDLVESQTQKYRSLQQPNTFFNRPPIKFRQKVVSVEKINAGFETKNDYTGVLFMGFFGKDEEMLASRPLFGQDDGDMKSYFTEEVVALNKILEHNVDSLDVRTGYVSVWDDAKKVVRGQTRTKLRVSGPAEAQTKFTDAMNVKVSKTVSIQTIDDDRYDVIYTLERVRDFNNFDNSSFTRHDILDSELIAAATNGEIERLRQMYRSGANQYAKGVIQATITSPNVTVDVLNAIMDEGVKPTTEDLDVAFDPDYFNPYKVLALLERGAKPKNNMIYKAVAYNYPSVVYALLREGAKPINNDLDFAIRKKRYAIAKALMDEDIEGYTPNEAALDLAVENNDQKMIKRFIDLGGKATSNTFAKAAKNLEKTNNKAVLNLLVPVTEANNETLEAAARINDLDLYKHFISKHAKITDNTSVERAIENKNNEILKIALDNNAEPTEALHYAIKNDNKSAVILSLESQAKPDTAFDYAIEKADDKLFEAVLDKYQGNPTKALQAAIKGNNIKLAQAAIKKGANPDLGIQAAIAINNPDILQLLLDNGAKPNTALKTAVEAGLPKLTKIALNYKADPSVAIKTAVTQNDTQISLILLQAGANPKGLLKIAVQNNNLQLVDKLINLGADPQEAITLAVDTNATTLVKTLIEAGANVTSSSLMDKAVNNKNSNMAQLLFDNGCDVSKKFTYGNTYLHKIANMDTADGLMQTFIGFGLDINAQNSLGETPLHIAVQKGNGNYKTVNILLKSGANATLKTKKRKSVLRLAKGSEIKKLLSDFGIKR